MKKIQYFPGYFHFWCAQSLKQSAGPYMVAEVGISSWDGSTSSQDGKLVKTCGCCGDMLKESFNSGSCELKVHFVIHSLIPPFFSKKVEIFTSAEAFRFITACVQIFLANSFAWRNNRPNCLFFMST